MCFCWLLSGRGCKTVPILLVKLSRGSWLTKVYLQNGHRKSVCVYVCDYVCVCMCISRWCVLILVNVGSDTVGGQLEGHLACKKLDVGMSMVTV